MPTALNAADPAFASLKVWQDYNSNGQVDGNELNALSWLTYTDYGPNEIDLRYGTAGSTAADANGNQHLQLGNYTNTSGQVRSIEDIWFATDTSNQAVQNASVPDDIAALPDLPGLGGVPSLHQAMANDATLKSLVIQFQQATSNAQAASLMRDILWRWTGADTQAAGSRGTAIDDARWLYMTEAFDGTPFVQGGGPHAGSSNPGPAAASDIYAIARQMFDSMYSQLAAQTRLKSLYDQVQATWNPNTSLFDIDVSQAAASLSASTQANHGAGVALIADFVQTLSGAKLLNATTTAQLQGALASLGSDVAALLNTPPASLGPVLAIEQTRSGNDAITGTPTNDTLYGAAGNDNITGLAGADELIGGTGADTLDGGAGNDALSGNDGADTYLFNLGSGQDTIYNNDNDAVGVNADQIQLGAGITTANLKALRNGADLLLSVNGTSDSLRVQGYFDQDGGTAQAVESIRFADGSSWTVNSIKSLVLQTTTGNDALTGYASNDSLSGGAGNDTLMGQGGADTLDGGAGVDVLDGGAGNNTYLFGKGDGQDTVQAYWDKAAGRLGTLAFKSGVAPAEVTAMRLANDLVLSIAGTGDTITVQSFFIDGTLANTPNPVQQIVFADGTVWARSALAGMAPSPTAGADDFIGTPNADTLHGGAGNDRISGAAGNDVLYGEADDDVLLGGLGTDVLDGGTGNDMLDGGAGADTLIGGAGNDVYVVDDAADVVTEAAGGGIDTVQTSVNVQLAAWWTMANVLNKNANWIGGVNPLAAQVENLTLLPATQRDTTLWRVATGNELNNRIDASQDAGAVVLDGGAGADTMIGNAQSNVYRVDNTADVIVESATPLPGSRDQVISSASYTLPTGVEDLLLSAVTTSYVPLVGTGNSADNVLDGGNAAYAQRSDGTYEMQLRGVGDTLVGLDGNDTYYIDDGDVVVEAANGGIDTVYGGHLDASQLANVENLNGMSVLGDARDNIITGTFGGNDTLIGGAGNDQITDTPLIGPFLGWDRDLNLQYNDADLLDGGDGNDVLTTTLGFDTVRGGHGDDLIVFADRGYTVASSTSSGSYGVGSNGTVLFSRGDGNDTIKVETFYGSPIGSSLLSFQGGLDITDLTFTVQGSDLVMSLSNAGGSVRMLNTFANDATVDSAWLSSISFEGRQQSRYDSQEPGLWSPTTWDQIIRQRLLTQNTNVTTAGDDFLVGTRNADLLDGGAGNDMLFGGAGDDTLLGGAGTDTLRGGDGNDVLSTGPNASASVGYWQYELLDGGYGNDTYQIDAGAQFVKIIDDGGIDTIQLGAGINAADILVDMNGGCLGDLYKADGTFDLMVMNEVGRYDPNEAPDAYNIETVRFADGTVWDANKLRQLSYHATSGADEIFGFDGDDNIAGLGGNDTLWGYGGNDTLDGGSGTDSLVGGTGNDTYVVDSASDVVVENANEGTDTIQSSVTLTLKANVENLTLTGSSAINGTGNTLNNVLTGNSAANVLTGGTGNDTYYVSTGDTVTEAAGAGTDTVISDVSFTLGANVENLTLTGSTAINATGNTLNNVLTGNSAANTLSGGTGNDTMIGGAGNDTYIVDSASDVVTENAGEGTDLVQSSVTYTLASNVENLTLTGTTAINATGNTLDNLLTGNSANNTLTGGAGNDTLDGGAGNDTMLGGTGNDTYVVNVATDVVTENANEGTDTVQAAVTYTLGSNVENLTLTGSSAINATGNALDNILTGNSAANVLTGGAGNDTYYVGTGDTVTEAASAGTDTVVSSIAWTLGSNLENLTLTGTTAINGTGNTLNNVLIGNSAANTLSGLAGNDTLDGGAGNDTLNGGAGADTYNFARGYGVDTIQDNDTTAGVKDSIKFAAGIAQSDMTFKHVGNNLEASINGTADKLVLQDWYLGSQYHVEQFLYADGTMQSDAQVQALVSAMAQFSGGPAGQTVLTTWRGVEPQLGVNALG